MAVSSGSAAASDQKKSQNQAKQRTTNPGVRVINGKIYDSEKGKTCHQCRQKTMSFVAACKNQNDGKPCPLNFCHTCLLNRYGEKAEEVEVLDKWSCPKCRGICNCSFCRKKRGHQPTGILFHRAKATGYSSVSELLHVNGPENFGLVKNVKDTGASPKKQSASEKETLIASPTKKGKENSFDGRVDNNLKPSTPLVNASRNVKSKELGKMQDGTLENDGLSKCSPCLDKKPKKIKQGTSKKLYTGQKDTVKGSSFHVNKKVKKNSSGEELGSPHDGGISSGALLENSPKKPRISNVSNNNDVKPNGKVDGVLKVGDGCKTKVSVEVPINSSRNKKRNADKDLEEPDNKKTKSEGKHDTVVQSLKDNRNRLQFHSQDIGADIPLPSGTELTTIAGVKLSLKDVGNALQFLEFCATFGKTLNMKKGQSSIILQELVNGRSRTLRRSEQHSAVVQFHIQLLSLLQKEYEERPQTLTPSRGKNSWLLALKNCISDSPNAGDSLPIDCLDREAGGYDTLDSSTKLRLLIFLCDEALETARIRDWINDQDLKLAKKAKQAKEKVLAAKDKEKSLKQKMMNELAEAIIAKDGASLSILEHDEIVCRIKSEAAQAHKEMLESMNMVPKTKVRAEAVRTEPIFLDVVGRAFWRLNGYSDKSNILVQDIGSGDDSVVLGEKWVAFDEEQEKVVENHISFRERRVRAQTVAEIVPSQTKVADIVPSQTKVAEIVPSQTNV